MFKTMLGLATSNPWVSVILLVVLIGAGFSGGVWLESLIKNASISKLKLDAEELQVQLKDAKANAVSLARSQEAELNARQAAVEKWYQEQLKQKEKEHEQRIAHDRQFAKDHPDRDFVLPDGTGLNWVQEQPTKGDGAAKPNLPEAGGAVAGADGGATECRLSDLLIDRDNYKSALSSCSDQVRALQRKVLDDLQVINRAH